jgi:glycosyltransferase involved in cell wall biosynthesis
LFSVIIPTLNEEENLGGCFKSLMEQTCKDFEVIIVDGGSQDRTIDLAERNGFDILEVEKTRPHDVSAAKNEGARHARGDVLFFLDADMALDPNCFEVLVDEYANPDVVGVSCRVLPIEGNSLENRMYKFNNFLVKYANLVGVHELSYFSCHSYLKDCFEKVGGFRMDLLACEDLDLSLRLRHLGRYIVTPRTTLWTSPRRLREWSYSGYVLRYMRYLIQYYMLKRVADLYDDL